MTKEKGVTGGDKFFKSCNHCKTPWTLEQIVNDPQIKPIGISFGDDTLKECYYFFRHDTPNCGTSFVINVLAFAPLITEPIPHQILTSSDTCEHHCIYLEDLNACGQECLFAPFRRFLLRMVSIKEQMSTTPSPQK